jgi:hypothetical protein
MGCFYETVLICFYSFFREINLKQIAMKNNLMVYIKLKDSRRFEALQSIKEFTIAPNLMYAYSIPFDYLDSLKKWANTFKDLCIKEGVIIQIRGSKDRKTVLHEVSF